MLDHEFIIIGGGAVGCGVAYALAKAGHRDILVLERAPDVGLATTSQGAGLCGQVRDSVERIHLAMHSVATFRELQRDPEVQPDWHEVGSLRIALNDRRAKEFTALKQAADAAGLETAFLDPAEAGRHWPAMDFTQTKAVLWCPSDGYMTPGRVVKAYQHQCRKLGVRFATDTVAEEVLSKDAQITGVR